MSLSVMEQSNRMTDSIKCLSLKAWPPLKQTCLGEKQILPFYSSLYRWLVQVRQQTQYTIILCIISARMGRHDSLSVILRKKVISLLRRVRGSCNKKIKKELLKVISDSGDCKLIEHMCDFTRSLLVIKF